MLGHVIEVMVLSEEGRQVGSQCIEKCGRFLLPMTIYLPEVRIEVGHLQFPDPSSEAGIDHLLFVV